MLKASAFPPGWTKSKGFSRGHIDRALRGAKEPALLSKLQNMPVPLTADMVDRYMGKVLESAATGDLDMIENI